MRIKEIGINNKQNKNFKIHRRYGTSDYLFLLFKSPSYVLENGIYKKVNAGECILLSRNSFQSYYPDNCDFLQDYIQIDLESEYEESFFSAIPQNTVINISSPSDISNSLMNIMKEFYSPSQYKSEILYHAIYIFLIKLQEQCSKENETPYYNELLNIRAKIYSNPQNYQTVTSVAQELHISESYTQLIYKKTFGISCINDIIKARIKVANHLLLHSNLSICEIAYACGYNNVEHFIRQYKKNEGISPKQHAKKVKSFNYN